MCFKIYKFKFRNFSIFFYNQKMRRSPSCESNFDANQQQNNKSGHQQLNFIQKAYDLVNNPKNSDIIHWSRSGLTFIIQDIQKFQRQLLPLYFRHNRYQSFVRQLNMYDFHKIRNGDYYCDNKSEFRHEEFSRGNYQAISLIRRKGFQVKNKQKQNTKLKKGHKNGSKKNIRRGRINPFKPIVAKIEVQAAMDQQDNSFFAEIPNQEIKTEVENKGQLRAEIFDKILKNSIDHFQKTGIQIFYKRSRINQIIDLAEEIKEQWLQKFDKISSAEDIRDMKGIYHFAKDQLIQKIDNFNESSEDSGGRGGLGRPVEEDFQQIGEEEDAIIESIFKAEIRSTLICITSQTFLHSNNHRKYDTLIGI